MTAASPPTGRRHDLDWLRALAILALLLFHSAMPFVAEWDWHIRNAETSELLLEFNFFISRFRMALLFLIAGVAAQFVLRRRTVGAFLRDRATRLLVPLVFGVLVIVPPQIYFERLADGAFTGSYLEFWPRTLRFEPYPAGDLSYHHLWFIFYLFVYGVLLAPAMWFARTRRGEAKLSAVRRWLGRRGVHALAVPIVATYALLVQRFDGAQDIVHDGAMFLVYLGYFTVGWLVGNAEVVWRRIEEGRFRAFTAALVMLLVINGVRWNDATPASGYSAARLAWLALLGANAWAWVITVLGYGARWLDRDHAVLRWSRDASYPFYILHQTVIVAVAYYVVRTDEPVMAKFLFTSVVSLLLTLALYEAFVRPYDRVRWLFGMSPRRAQPGAGASPAPAKPVIVAVEAMRTRISPWVSPSIGSVLLIAALLVVTASSGAAQADRDLTRSRVSVTGGGMWLPESRLATAAVALERGRYAVAVGLTHDGTRQTWDQDGSRGTYLLRGHSVHLRRYARSPRRGLFIEVGAGSAALSLRVVDSSDVATERRASLPLASWGVGTRLSLGRTTWFVELGYRSAVPLAARLLHSDPVAPVGAEREQVSYHAWSFARGRATGQLTLGLGTRR